jgi:hypothetical protein
MGNNTTMVIALVVVILFFTSPIWMPLGAFCFCAFCEALANRAKAKREGN